MRTLVLVRHGQYDSLTGELTDLGRRQAAATGRALRQYDFDTIRCSTLIRAQHEQILASCNETQHLTKTLRTLG